MHYFIVNIIPLSPCVICSVNGGKAYQEGHTYIYDLEGTSQTSVPGAQDEATLKLKGTVELSVKPDCVRQIRLKGVQVNGAVSTLYVHPDIVFVNKFMNAMKNKHVRDKIET